MYLMLRFYLAFGCSTCSTIIMIRIINFLFVTTFFLQNFMRSATKEKYSQKVAHIGIIKQL